MTHNNGLYGWYDSATQEAPTYDPPHDAPCPYCGEALRPDDVRTHSLMAAARNDETKSYFYRTHRTCDEQAGEGEERSIFSAVLAKIEHDGLPI